MKYIKKPIPIEAIQLAPYYPEGYELPEWFNKALEDHTIQYSNTSSARYGMTIKTLEGSMFAPWGSYIICGVKGELYPCRAEIFEETYEKYEESKE